MKELVNKILSLYELIDELEGKLKDDREHLKEIKQRRDQCVRELLLGLYEAND